jgi:glycosyltransferase involved in cell wall biosynthesis
MIFFDAERFIEEAIRSVFAQTYPEWELLLIDDGSTDSSGAIARIIAQDSPGRVRYLTHDGHSNRGMSASRNLGIQHAQGEFVALLDADDVWRPSKLDHQVGLLESESNAAMVYGPTEWWYSWTGHPDDMGRDFIHHLGVDANALIEPPTLLAHFLVDEGISPCTCSILVRKDVLDRVGGFEDSFRDLYEDQVLCAKICLDFPVFASSECSYRYRQHGGSALSRARREGTARAARLAFLDWLDGYLGTHGVRDPDLVMILDQERRRLRWPNARVNELRQNAAEAIARLRMFPRGPNRPGGSASERDSVGPRSWSARERRGP